VLHAANPIFQAAGLTCVLQGKPCRGQAPGGGHRGLSNPYHRQIPSYAFGSVGEKMRSFADFAVPGVAGASPVRRTNDVSQQWFTHGDVGTEDGKFAVPGPLKSATFRNFFEAISRVF
jgi:hypothetical protein